jgi:hypothetical protein
MKILARSVPYLDRRCSLKCDESWDGEDEGVISLLDADHRQDTCGGGACVHLSIAPHITAETGSA